MCFCDDWCSSNVGHTVSERAPDALAVWSELERAGNRSVSGLAAPRYREDVQLCRLFLGAPVLRPGRDLQFQFHLARMDSEGPSEKQGLREFWAPVALLRVSGSYVQMLHLWRAGQISRDSFKLLAGRLDMDIYVKHALTHNGMKCISYKNWGYSNFWIKRSLTCRISTASVLYGSCTSCTFLS